MITISINDQEYHIEKTNSLHDLLLKNNHVDLHFAVAINNQLIPRIAYNTTVLQANDRIDIIVPMQGG